MLFFIIIVLLITNAVAWMLVFTGSKRSDQGKRKMRMEQFLQDDVGFSNDQMAKYREISKKNFDGLRTHMETTRNEKESILKELSLTAFTDSSISIAAHKIAAVQVAGDSLLLTNIRQLRELCTPDQLQKFDEGWYRQLGRHRRKASR